MKYQEIAAGAAKEMRSRGYVKGRLAADPDNLATCAVCADGAIRAYLTGSPIVSLIGSGASDETINGYDELTDHLAGEVRRRLREKFPESIDVLGGSFYDIYDHIDYNDASFTTEEDVLDLLDTVASE